MFRKERLAPFNAGITLLVFRSQERYQLTTQCIKQLARTKDGKHNKCCLQCQCPETVPCCVVESIQIGRSAMRASSVCMRILLLKDIGCRKQGEQKDRLAISKFVVLLIGGSSLRRVIAIDLAVLCQQLARRMASASLMISKPSQGVGFQRPTWNTQLKTVAVPHSFARSTGKPRGSVRSADATKRTYQHSLTIVCKLLDLVLQCWNAPSPPDFASQTMTCPNAEALTRKLRGNQRGSSYCVSAD